MATRARILMGEGVQDFGRLRIAFVIDSVVGWTAGGTERQLAWLIGSLDRRCFEPALFVLKNTSGLKIDRPSCPVYVLNAPSKGRSIKLFWDLRRQLSRFRPQIVQTFFYDATLLGTIAARSTGVPIIVQSRRSVGHSQLGFVKRLVFRVANQLTTSWQCNSQFVAASISQAEGIPKSRIEIFPNILDSDYFRPAEPPEREVARRKLGLPIDTPVFISVSNLRPVKDLLTLVRAALQVREQIPDARFAIIGEGPLQEDLAKEIGRLRLNSVVRLVGKQADVRTWLAAADIGILTSRSEGSSNALLEYIATGLPAIVSDIPANHELVHGVFFRTGDPADLAEKLLRLWQDPGEQGRLRDEHREQVKAHSPDAIVLRLHRYYSSLAANHLCE